MVNELFIDAVILKGQGRTLGVKINQRNEVDTDFEPLDLTDFAVRFRVLGSATKDAEVLVEHIITQFTDPDVDGEIYNAQGGEFSFCINRDDTEKLGLGKFPISIDLLDVETLEYVDTITEGGENGEFNKVFIVEV